MLGVVYYLSKQTFEAFISALSSILPKGSQVIFDYPDEINCTDQAGERAKKGTSFTNMNTEGKEALYRYNGLGQKIREQISVRKDGETVKGVGDEEYRHPRLEKPLKEQERVYIVHVVLFRDHAD